MMMTLFTAVQQYSGLQVMAPGVVDQPNRSVRSPLFFLSQFRPAPEEEYFSRQPCCAATKAAEYLSSTDSPTNKSRLNK